MTDASIILIGVAAAAIRVAAADAVREGAMSFAARLRAKTPISRRKTRRHTKAIHRKGELTAAAGVVFPANSRYETSGTKTREIVKQVYESDGQQIVDEIANQLRASIENQPLTTVRIGKG